MHEQILPPSSEQSMVQLAQLDLKSIQQLKALKKIPDRGLTLSLAILRVHAGVNSDVDVSSKADPKQVNWQACQKMMRNPRKFVKECREMFDKIGKDATLDRHIEEVRKTLKPEDLNLYNLKCISHALYIMGGWMHAILDSVQK